MWSPEALASLEEIKREGGKRLETAIASLQNRIKQLDEKIQDLNSQVTSTQNSVAYYCHSGNIRGAQLVRSACQAKSFKLLIMKGERLDLTNRLEFLNN